MPEHEHPASERIGAAIAAAAAQVGAPEGLRERIVLERRRRGVRYRRRVGATALAAAVSATAVAVALVFAPAPGSPGAPSVADAAAVALRPPTGPAPAPDPGDPRFVRASVGGIRFPNYAYGSRWWTLGRRSDTLGGRRSETVTYARGSMRVAYTIVDGPPLPAASGARLEDAAGTPVWVTRLEGALVVTWERARHTCVLASRTTTLPELLGFVAWRGRA